MRPNENVDLDQIVDYRAEYAAVVEKHKIVGDNLTGLCPFHKDTNNSFSVDLKTGQWHCFSEDIGGNFISFWAKYHGYDTKTAYKDILNRYGIRQEERQAEKPKSGSDLLPYTVEQYGFDKRLPVDFLKQTCRVETGKDRDGTEYLKMPYFFENGKPAATRKRYGQKEFRWMKGSRGKICLYGEWRIAEIKKVGWCILVEGESDTQSLWYMGLPAIGVAGASMFKAYQTMVLQGLKVYIHKEPDGGGETFYKKLCHAFDETGFDGELFVWSCQSLGKKDPSDVYLAYDKDEGKRLIQEAIKKAKPVDLKLELQEETASGAPVSLRTPKGWKLSDSGIFLIDAKTRAPVLICRTPIILTRRIANLETGEEKIEVAFKDHGEEWTRGVYARHTVFSRQSIMELANSGCTVTSENAKNVVKFLMELEAENYDEIPTAVATSSFGWQVDNRFLPGCDKEIVLDIDPTLKPLAAAYCQNGTMERWIEHMAPHRQRDKFRFILAASFAAPLLRIVKQRIFFVYNWGGSKGGKTAALKAALSAWGDPERLMVNFNATQVGLERTAAFYCDLPLGIDERQLAGNNQGSLEKIVYMIASGTGKIRGAKSGGIQTVQQWRTVALATGEEPLSTDTSQTGVSTRVLELYGGPFDNEQDAALMHQQATLDCGWAGPAFIDHLLQMDEREIVEQYEEMQTYVREISNGKNGSHIAGIAAVALADSMIDQLFFGGSPEQSREAAKRMAASILINQVESNATDVNENAVQFVVDWVLANKAYFGQNAVGTCLGFTSDTGNTAYIFPTMLNQALSKAGYSPRKTMKYLAERELIGMTVEGSGKKIYSVTKWFGSRSVRFVEFYIGKIAEAKDPIDDADEIGSNRESDAPEYQQQSFTELTDADHKELPF